MTRTYFETSFPATRMNIKFWKENVRPKWLRIKEDQDGDNYGLLEGRYCRQCDENSFEVANIKRSNCYHPFYYAHLVCGKGHTEDLLIEPCPHCETIWEQEALYDGGIFNKTDDLIGCMLCEGRDEKNQSL